MKIKITEIEASAEEMRQSNSLADAFTNVLRNIFNPLYRNYGNYGNYCDDEKCEEDTE